MSTSARPVVLGLDAATPPSSVALVGGEEILGSRTGPFGKGTDAWIHGAVEEVLATAGVGLDEIDVVAATAGPGTFTGIRVGLAAAAGLGRGLDRRVAGTSTLEALVGAARTRVGADRPVLAVVDARRGKLYAGLALEPGAGLSRGPELVDPDAVAGWIDGLDRPAVLGTGLDRLSSDLALERLEDAPPVAVGAALATVIRLRRDESLPPARPLYLRQPDAIPGASPLRRRRPRRK